MKARKISSKIMSIFLILTVIIATSLNLYARENNNAQGVKHIILFIGDGMHLEHEIATSRYLYGTDYSLSWHMFSNKVPVATWDVTTYNGYASLMGAPSYDPYNIDPITGYNPNRGGKWPFPLDRSRIDDNYFLNPRFATDSASAGTAISTGYKTDDGNIAWLPGDPPNGRLKTIAEILREEKGFAIGVVSTVPFSHATPAAFVSHNVHRNNYYQIADEIARVVKPEVVIGGGHRNWSTTYMSAALYNDLKNGVISDYVFVERLPGVDGAVSLMNAAYQAVAQKKKLFGLFGGRGGNFEPPVPSDTPGSPSVSRATIENPLLKDATIAALEVLSKDPDGFFLMVEQGDIDWANHANNYRWMIGTVWDLEEAVKAAISFVNRPDDNIDWSNTMIIVTSDHGNSYMRLTDEPKLSAGDLPTQIGRDYAWSYPDGEVTYSTTNHTNELVMLYAFGKNSKLFNKYRGEWYPCTQIIDNTHIFHVMAEAAGVPKPSPLQVILHKPVSCSNFYSN
ncbi:MAG: alkaline phosphatase [Thermodesulfovibrionales bacterium]|nr:alkaline phosphatase [Thermodesulfovibrionales bacterium]